MNCSNDFPTTDVFYSEISDDPTTIVFLVLALVLSVAQVLIFLEEILFIQRNHKDRSRVSKILMLLGLYPVMSVTAAIALLVPTSAILVDLLASCYLSVCICMFVSLIIEYFNGEDGMVDALSDNNFVINTPPLCCCCVCLPRGNMTRRKLFFYKLIVTQVAVARPMLLFVAAVLWTDGKYVRGSTDLHSPSIYITLLSAVSTVSAMYGLVVFYRNTRTHLQHQKLTIKFTTLQVAVVVANVQILIFSILAKKNIPECIGSRGSNVRGSNLNHGVMIVEFFILSLLARYGYRQPEILGYSKEMEPEDSYQHQANGGIVNNSHVIDYNSLDNTETEN